MKKYFVILLIILAVNAHADDRTVKIDGKTIVLHDDFTWNYIEVPKSSSAINLSYNQNQTLVLSGKNDKYKIHINPNEWAQTTDLSKTAQFQFINKDDTGFGMLVYEGLSYPLNSLKEAMIINANEIDPNARIISIEECSVNNTVGELVTYTANYSELKFVFYSYITTSDNGTIQFTFYTLENEFEKLKSSFLEAISGFEFNE